MVYSHSHYPYSYDCVPVSQAGVTSLHCEPVRVPLGTADVVLLLVSLSLFVYMLLVARKFMRYGRY